MSVTNYTPDNCRYWIGKLSKHVYLISEDAVKDIRIDNGEAWVQSVSESPIRIDCISISLSEEESLDERYKFVHTLSFSVNGYANKDDFQGRYYVIVKDNNNTYWLVNPLFPCKVTYTYTLANEQNQTDFTIGTASNHPVLKLNGMSEGEPYQCQDYWLDGIDKIWLNEKRYSVHDGNNVKYTNDGFKVIDYNGKSATFTESFDGDNTRHSIEFNVLFSDYKSSWHYNLLEIVDECLKNNNLYSAIIKTRNDKYAMCGFSFGLQPSFNISADDTTQEINRIQITLQDAHTVGDAIDILDSVNYEYLSARTWVYTDEYDGYECVGNGVAKYLLQKEVDALGNDTCNYKALAGYETNFPELNIVGTFDDEVTFTKNECRIVPCRLSTSLPLTLTFSKIESQTYTIMAGSSWSIESSVDYITVNPSSGNPDTYYTIEVHNSKKPTSYNYGGILTVHYCDTASTFSVNVLEYDGCFTEGTSYEISANEQVLTIPTKCCVQYVKDMTNAGASTVIYDSYLQVSIPENNTGRYRTITLLAVMCDGSVSNITITQSNVFEEWRDGGETFCEGMDKYKIQYLWTGETSSSYVQTTTTRDVLVESFSQDCVQVRWVNTYTTTCIENEGFYDKYYLFKKQISTDGINWTDSVPAEIMTSGDSIGTYSDLTVCEQALGSRWTATDNTVCIGSEDNFKLQLYSSKTSTEPYETVRCTGSYTLSDDDFDNYNTLSTWKVHIGGCVSTVARNTMWQKSVYKPREFVMDYGVIEFEQDAFNAFTTYVKHLVFPDSVKRIGMNCFMSPFYEAGRMSGQKGTITIGKNIEYIGFSAFYNTDYIESITILAKTPPEIGYGAFKPYQGEACPIYVPSESVTAYRTSPTWRENIDINRIQPIS